MNKDDTDELAIENLFSLKNKVVMITGGSGGLGLIMATGLLRNGAKVIIASRSQERCDDAVASISGLGDISAIAADVSSPEGRQAIVDTIDRKFGKLDVLINNAGTNFAAPLKDYTDEAFAKVVNTNLTAVFALTRDLAPLLAKGASQNDPSRVLNIGSMDGIHVPIVQRVPTFAYSSSKAALHHLTKSLAVDLAPQHITVNTIAPGFFASKMTGYVFEHYLKDIEDDCPLKRVGQPAEIVGIALYLASPAGAYTNGTVIPVDGGTSISKGSRPWMDN